MREFLRARNPGRGVAVGLLVLLGTAPAAGQTAREVEDVFWRDVVCERELEVRAYLEVYPDGVYVSEARACLERGLGLTRAERIRVQAGLQAAGQEPGPADGLFGGPEAKTRRAIRAWQAAKGLAATGYLDREQAETLMAQGEDAEDTRRAAAEQAAREEAARQAAAADDAAYAAAEGADTAAAYGEYLEAYPAGRHAAAARERQAARREGEAFRVGRTFRDDLRSGGEGPQMVVVPAGAFRMGCVSGQGCDDDERPVHRVTIGSPFAVGVYEVTFAEWDACVADGGCGRHRPDDAGWGRGRRPVVNVSWKDAQAYVARAGSETAYSWGEEIGENRANCRGCGSRWDTEQTAPVGSFGANGFGLHDVHGNVMEWVEDCWNDSYVEAPADGSAWEEGDCNLRVLRGGSWFIEPGFLRSANRSRVTTGGRYDVVGFRVARSLTP